MAWNPSPKVADARALGRKWGASGVIIFLLDDATGTLEGISYGKTRALCADVGALMDIAMDALEGRGQVLAEHPELPPPQAGPRQAQQLPRRQPRADCHSHGELARQGHPPRTRHNHLVPDITLA